MSSFHVFLRPPPDSLQPERGAVEPSPAAPPGFRARLPGSADAGTPLPRSFALFAACARAGGLMWDKSNKVLFCVNETRAP